MEKEFITHDELCERIGNTLKLYDVATLLEVCKIIYDEVQVKYLGDSDYSWEQKQDL